MQVILTNLSGIKKEESGKLRHLVKAGSRWPMTIGNTKSVDYYPFPFYIAYSTALLKREFPDLNVRGIDGVARDYTAQELLDDLKTTPPDILIAEVTMITLKDDLRFIREIKEKYGCLVIVTGVYVAAYKEAVLKDNPFIDYAIYGEYEMSLKELIGCLMEADKEGMKDIRGILLRNGDIFVHPERAKVNDLNDLPFPDRDDFPLHMYADFSMLASCASIVSSRGCPAGCVFCVERHVIYNSPKHRTRDPKSVVDEMELCIHKGARQFYFDDMSFVINRKFVHALCEEMIARKLDTPWTCMGDAMFVNYEMLKIMKKAGCIGMKFGIESANKDILKTIGKPLNTTKAIQVAQWCKELGILTHATFCLGLPGENEETIKETVAFMDKINLDSAQISRAVPYPGTPLYTWAKQNNYLTTEDLNQYDGASKSVLNYPGLPAERIDYWYDRIFKKLSRKKLLNYIKHPANSFDILYNMCKQKGALRTLQSATTFVSRIY